MMITRNKQKKTTARPKPAFKLTAIFKCYRIS